VVSGSWRDSPVLGFLPVRAARVLVLKVPKLARLTVNHNNAHKHADTVRQASSICHVSKYMSWVWKPIQYSRQAITR
jgi:hypothetical protein